MVISNPFYQIPDIRQWQNYVQRHVTRIEQCVKIYNPEGKIPSLKIEGEICLMNYLCSMFSRKKWLLLRYLYSQVCEVRLNLWFKKSSLSLKWGEETSILKCIHSFSIFLSLIKKVITSTLTLYTLVPLVYL